MIFWDSDALGSDWGMGRVLESERRVAAYGMLSLCGCDVNRSAG